MPRGSCLCGDVAWESGGLSGLHDCHCSRCRKAHAAPFVAWAHAKADEFRWLRGEGGVALYASSAGFERAFCERCGSALPGRDGDGGPLIPIGCLDDEPGCESMAHVHTASLPPWSAITDGVAQFEALPPGFEQADVPEPKLPEAVDGAIRGSCLCGTVSWLVTERPQLARYCHCSRCRKARSAACTANLFVSCDGIRFLSGEDATRSYNVPDARYFRHVFCTTCGGGTPRVDLERKLAVVPMGSLDDDPGARISEHIFVGSKAPWHEITDDIPQYEEGPPA